MGQCPDSIKRLIDRFNQQSDQVRSADYNETLIRIDFINPLMRELGWDVDNSQGFAEQYREVVHEDRVKVAGATKAPDYSFRVGGQRKFFLEAKKPFVNIKQNWEPAYQLRRYAWSAKLPVSLLTDFEELAIYDTRLQPKQFDKPATARREYIQYTDYCQRWDFLEGTFSKRAVYEGEFDRYAESKKGRGAQPVDDAFLKEIEEWRKSLAGNLALRNEALSEPALNFAVQKIIDRIIFLRIAEDRGTEQTGQLMALLNGDHVYQRLVTVFNRADERYNSGLFHFHTEKDRQEEPDRLTPALAVDDRTLKQIIKALYYPESPYEFTMLSADILGSIYERFLGRVITLTPGHRAKIQDKPEVRKAGGVYYTPTYIVDYIVKNTVGKLLESKEEGGGLKAEVQKAASAASSFRPPLSSLRLKILDPACGSGSFLIGAYQFLLDWHLQRYLADDPATLATGKNPVLRPTPTGGWALAIAERKRILLAHIHGVDIDAQAVEVTKLNLLLKCLEGETSQTLGFEQRLFRERALPDLAGNIKCGNSLIGTDIIGTEAWNAMSEEEKRRINPFDYERAFAQVFRGKDGGGFDAVIGNPPYGADFAAVEKSYYQNRYESLAGKPETYLFFLSSAVGVLRPGGLAGMIVPNAWLTNYYGINIRRWLLDNTSVTRVVDLEPVKVFKQATVDTCICVTAKTPPTSNSTAIVARWSPPDAIADAFSVPQSSWVSHPEHVINVHANPADEAVLAKLESTGLRLGQFLEFSQGLIPYETKAEGEANRYISNRADGNDWLPLLESASQVRRYELDAPTAFVKHGSWLCRPRERRFFASPKILFHRLRKKLPRQLVGALDTAGYANRHSLSNLVLLPGHPSEMLLGALGVFNSRLINWWFCKRYGLLMEVGKFKVDQIPLPRDWTSDYRRLTSLVSSMLSLHKRLAAETIPQRRTQIEREIEATDRQIDQLIYQLYGLTGEEIAIVESATAAGKRGRED